MRQTLVALGRLIGFFAAVFGGTALAIVPWVMILGDLDGIEARLEILVIGSAFLASVAVVSVGMWWIGKSQLVRSGWPDRGVGTRWFAVGVLVGLGLAGAMLAVTWASGGARLVASGGELSQYLRYTVPLVAFLLVAALGEEWIFRGYPLAVLTPVMGPGWANVLVALVFTASHWGGSGWNVLAATNIFLFSLVNGAIRYTPGGIPAAWGFHFAWNSLQVLSGAVLTGIDLRVPLVRFSSQGPDWLSGGAFGPEGALGATAATIIGLLLIRRFSSTGRWGWIGAK